MTNRERAADLWYSVHEDAESKQDSRSQLVEYLKLEAGIAKQLAPKLREAINPPDIPIANDGKTDGNIAYSALNVMSICHWINEHDEPVRTSLHARGTSQMPINPVQACDLVGVERFLPVQEDPTEPIMINNTERITELPGKTVE